MARSPYRSIREWDAVDFVAVIALVVWAGFTIANTIRDTRAGRRTMSIFLPYDPPE